MSGAGDASSAASRGSRAAPGANVLVVVPALDEQQSIEAVIQDLASSLPGARLLVVDDGSGDLTAGKASALGASVARLPFHLGYGAALQTGIRYGRREGFEIVVTFDADGQHSASDVPRLIEAVRAGADLAIGSRALSAGSYRGGVVRRVGRRLLAALTRLLTGLRLTDPTSGLKAMGPRGQWLYALSRFPDRFPDADALVLARRAQLRIVECPARMRSSRNRHSMHRGVGVVAYVFNMLLSLVVAATGRDTDLAR